MNITPKTVFWGSIALGLVVMGSQMSHNANAQTPMPAPSSDSISADSDNSPSSGILPADIVPGSPLAQVIQLAQSGVDESIIMAFVTNSSGPFNLTSDQIIYLKDLGLPNEIVTAMIQQDQKFHQQPTQPISPPENTDQTSTAEPTNVTEDYFYDTLAPYGGWVNIEGYGLCWRPTVVIYDSGWQPYCDHGHWVYTDCGWYWMSDYSWGATTFHYGRWFHDPRYGWCWWPDTTWAPSWVTWRYANDYCGWAPLPPHCVYRSGVGIVYNGVVVSADFNFGLSVNYFTFVPTRDFCNPHPRHYRVAATQVAQIYNHTTIVNGYHFNNHVIVNSGIPPQHITAVSGIQIRPVTIHTTTTPLAHGAPGERFGQNNQTLFVNRPHFVENTTPSLNQGIRPHTEVPNWNNNRNNLSQPAANQNHQSSYNWSVPQNPQSGHPVPSPGETHQPQVHQNFSQQPPPASHYPTAPAPNNNSGHDHNTWYMPPKMQQQQPQSQMPHHDAPVEHNQSPPSHSAPAHSETHKSDNNDNHNSPGH